MNCPTSKPHPARLFRAYPTTSSYQGIVILKRCISEMYGPSGKMRQVADRFLSAIEDGKKSVEKDDS